MRLNKNFPVSLFTLLLGSILIITCNAEPERRKTKVDYIRQIPGENDSIPVLKAQRGEVLVAYSDCGTCHKIDKKSIGPAFKDIARRYPVQQAYIGLLAQKIIHGGTGSWGQAVMTAHPKVTYQDAEIMVNYILSLKDE